MRNNITNHRQESLLREAPGSSTASDRHSALQGVATALALLILAATMLHAPAVHATLYKWVDDQGVVHYTDKMPPEAINKGSVELNKQGITVKKNDPALTPEQRRVHEAEEERIRQVAKTREEKDRRDRALLQTYTTESEIDLTRNRVLSTIDGQLKSALAYSANLNKRKQEIEVRVAAPDGKPLPPTVERELASVNDELARQRDLINAKRKEIDVVNARYDADKQRWQQLRTMAETEASAAPSPAPAAAPAGGKMATGTPANPTPTKK